MLMISPVTSRAVFGLTVIASIACGRGPTPTVDALAARAPGVRNAHALAYDAMRHRVILFGGANDGAVLRETWSWNGQRWARLDVAGPLPRTFPAVTHDAQQKVVYMYGGHRALFGNGQAQDTVLGDFWKWDGTRWTPLGADGPGVRAEAALAYDQSRRRLILFGGYRGAGAQRTRLGDTWEWDGSAWTKASERGPSPRNNAAMAYDAHRHVTVLFGGSDGAASGETWEWDGTTWSRSSAALTEPRYNATMVYDPIRRRMLRFGGWNGRERLGDTWSFDGLTWTRHDVDGPSPRNHSALTFDLHRERAVLFAGHDGTRVFGDTWEWAGDRWILVDSVPSRPRMDNGH